MRLGHWLPLQRKRLQASKGNPAAVGAIRPWFVPACPWPLLSVCWARLDRSAASTGCSGAVICCARHCLHVMALKIQAGCDAMQPNDVLARTQDFASDAPVAAGALSALALLHPLVGTPQSPRRSGCCVEGLVFDLRLADLTKGAFCLSELAVIEAPHQPPEDVELESIIDPPQLEAIASCGCCVHQHHR